MPPSPESFHTLVPETLACKQESWRQQGHTDNEIEELSALFQGLSCLKERVQVLAARDEAYWRTHSREKEARPGEEKTIQEQVAAIKEKRQAIKDALDARQGKPLAPEGDIKECTPEGREVRLNLKEILKNSTTFYQGHNLPEFARVLPKEIKISPENLERVREAMRQGFDRAMVMPGLEAQAGAGIPKLKAELANKELPGLSEGDQYAASYLNNAVKDQASLHPKQEKKRQKAYLLLYQSGPIPDATKDKTFTQAQQELDTLFGQGKWDGLTAQEYYILQRWECEQRKNHSFDAYSNETQKSQWTWLLDIRVPGGCAYAHWVPERHRVKVDWDRAGNHFPELGARPAVVVPIEI